MNRSGHGSSESFLWSPIWSLLKYIVIGEPLRVLGMRLSEWDSALVVGGVEELSGVQEELRM